MNDAQELGAALMEANVRRISQVDFDGIVYGNSLQELGEQAAKACQEFYGDHGFEIVRLSANELKNEAGTSFGYEARFSAVIR